MQMYELHRVDESTGKHFPILIGTDGDMRPAKTSQDKVEEIWAMALESEARPVERFEDGRIQVGHYLYVPVETEEP